MSENPAQFSLRKLFFVRFLLIASLIGNIGYLWWRINPLLWNNYPLSIILLIAEFVFFTSFVIHLPVLWFRKIPEKTQLIPTSKIKVAILIPTYNESLDILSPTIEHALNLNIPDLVRLKVVVLDDGNRPWLEEYVSEKQQNSDIPIEYMTRTERGGFKAGNINNYVLNHSEDDWILVLDADFVPGENILKEFFPYLGDSNIGFVQGPQVFDNIPTDDPLGQAPDIWFYVLEIGRAGQQSLICCGTPTILSVPALKKIGGMKLGMTEDFITGVTLQSYGYQAVYNPVEVAAGKASTDIGDVVNKADRYAAGAFEFLFNLRKWHLGEKLTTMQKFLHFSYPISFLAPLFVPVLIFLPIISLMTGISPFVIDSAGRPFLYMQLMSMISLQLLFFLLVGKKAWRAWQFYWGMFPACYAAILKVIFGKSSFIVSSKNSDNRISGFSQLKSISWQFIFFLLGLIALGHSIFLFLEGELNLSLYPAVGWLLLNTALLSGVVRPPLQAMSRELLKLTDKRAKYFISLGLTFLILIIFGSYLIKISNRQHESDFTIDNNVSVSSEKLANSLDTLNARLNTTSESEFQTFLFFVGWKENTIDAGLRQFQGEIVPLLDIAYARGMTPIITWEPRSSGMANENKFDITKIAEGKSDLYLEGWKEGLEKWFSNHPDYEVRIRLMHEMNAPIAEYPWSHLSPETYKSIYEHIFSKIVTDKGNLQWMLVFQNLTADADWQNKRTSDYEKYVPNVPIDYIGIDGYSRPFKKGLDGPPGGEVTPEQVLPESFFSLMREQYPQTKLVISETSVPYMEKTDEPVPYPPGKLTYQMTDLERSAWINNLQQYIIFLNSKYSIYEVTWFNGNTDYHWSLSALEDALTFEAFNNMLNVFKSYGVRMGIYSGEN